MIRKIVLNSLACLLTLVQALSQSWTSLNGPWKVSNGKDITVGYANSTKILYLADYGTNLKKSTNGGATWETTGTTVSTPQAVVCQSATADTLVVAVASEIKRSGNGGTTFGNNTSVTNLQPRRFGISSASPNNIFLGTAWPQSGSLHPTLYKSFDGGRTWDADYYFFNYVQTHINSVAFDPGNANKVVVAGSAVPILAAFEASPANEELAFEDPLKRGVFYSDDGGDTWNQIASGDLDGKSIASVAFSDSGSTTTIFAGTADYSSDDGELWKSTDYGSNWTQVFDRSEGSITFIAVNSTNHRIYVGNNRLGMSYSFDNGNTWYHDNSTTTHDAMFDWDIRGIAVHSSDANDLFAVSGSSVFYGTRSSAGLFDWQDKNTNISQVVTTAVSATSSTVLAVGRNFQGVARYSSGWRTYRASVSVLDKVFEPEAVAIDPYVTTRAAVGGRQHPSSSNSSYDALIFFNKSSGASNWDEKFRSSASYSGYIINSFAADPKEHVRRYALGSMKQGGTESNILLSLDNDSSWTIQSAIGGQSNAALCMVVDSTGGGTSTSQILYASVSAKGIYKSTNAGNNWSESFVNTYVIKSLALNTKAPQTIYASGDVASGSGLWKSTNSGSNWTGKRSDACPRVIMHPSYPSSVDYVWAIGSSGNQIFKTTDGGVNWDSVNASTLTRPFYDLRADNAVDSVIYVATAAGVVKINPAPEKTQGLAYGGNEFQHPLISWTPNSESDLAGYKLYRQECGPVGGFALIHIIGSDSSSYLDVTAGIGDGSAYMQYYIVAYDNQNNSATQSSTLNVPCTGNIDRAGLQLVPDEIPTKFQLFANYPNPFNPLTVIKYDLPQDEQVSLIVVDMLGRQVSVLVNQKQTAGYKSVDFDASKLASGMYLYKLVAGTFTDVKKMIVAK